MTAPEEGEERFSHTFQILSDLHLEVGQQYGRFDIPVAAPYLILAGDTGRLIDFDGYTDFLSRHAAKFDTIFLVLGNHEFYGLSHAAGLKQAHLLVSQDLLGGKVTLLEQTRFDVPQSNTTILGCTLWSLIPDDAKEIISRLVNDFRHIGDWTTETHNAAHRSDVAWLQQQVNAIHKETPEKRIVIVSHYPPLTSNTSEPRFANSPLNSAFSTDVLPAYGWPDVKLWVYGHTHYSNDFTAQGVRMVANQRGYVFNFEAEEETHDGYNVRKTVRILPEKN